MNDDVFVHNLSGFNYQFIHLLTSKPCFLKGFSIGNAWEIFEVPYVSPNWWLLLKQHFLFHHI